MRVFVVALALSVSLAAGPTFAQAPAPGAAAPAQQPPAAPAPPAPKPVPPAAAQPAPAPPQTKFADGLKYAYVVVQRVAQESAEGKAAAGKIEALRNEKVKELDGKNKALQSAELVKTLNAQTAEAVGGTSEAFGKVIRADYAKWAKVVKQSGARVD